MTGQPVYLNAMGMVCAAGNSMKQTRQRLVAGDSSLTRTDEFSPGVILPLGRCNEPLPPMPLPECKWNSRNNQLLVAALEPIRSALDASIKAYGKDRIGVVIGTSTPGISEAEIAVRCSVAGEEVPASYDYGMQEMGAPAEFLATLLELGGPVFSISTACSSGAKALASARRLIQAGLCDAVIAGGADSLCKLTVAGFSALEAISDAPCNPSSVNRNGINIGEGAALFLVSAQEQGPCLAGVGEGSDAHHISAPDPTGGGAERVMRAALEDASVAPDQVDYVNMHGTATRLNDQMEHAAIYRVLGDQVPCSSTKPFTGHTLGAAGAIEAAICWAILQAEPGEEWIPPHLWDGTVDPDIAQIKLVQLQDSPTKAVNCILSNSFAFGGSNVALLLKRTQ